MSEFGLPPADSFGNRWFGKPGIVDGEPAILKSSRGGYLLSLGEQGMHWTGNQLTRFKRPVNALATLNRVRRR